MPQNNIFEYRFRKSKDKLRLDFNREKAYHHTQIPLGVLLGKAVKEF